MTRESKLALMIAVTLILLVGVLLSDHLSGATVAEFDDPAPRDRVLSPVAGLPGTADPIASLVARPQPGESVLSGVPGLTVSGLSGPVALPEPVVISQGVQPMERSILSQALDGVGSGVNGAVDRFRASDPPALVGWSEEIFEPVGAQAVTLPPRDSRGSSPVKAVPDRRAGEAAALGGRFTTARPEPAAAWRTHTVVENDNLYRLASRYLGDGERWPELQRLNRDVLGEGTDLRVGQVIKIDAEKSGGAAPTKRVARPAPAAVAREYVVLKGDRLGEISLKLLGTTRRMKEIVELNGLKDPDDIRVGQTLKIPAK